MSNKVYNKKLNFAPGLVYPNIKYFNIQFNRSTYAGSISEKLNFFFHKLGERSSFMKNNKTKIDKNCIYVIIS